MEYLRGSRPLLPRSPHHFRLHALPWTHPRHFPLFSLWPPSAEISWALCWACAVLLCLLLSSCKQPKLWMVLHLRRMHMRSKADVDIITPGQPGLQSRLHATMISTARLLPMPLRFALSLLLAPPIHASIVKLPQQQRSAVALPQA